MPQSLSKNLIHLIFSTKDREPVLTREVREDLHRYFAGILKDLDSSPLVMDSRPDHVHLLFSLNKNLSLARAVMELKRGSSKWLKTQGPAFRNFHWQNGYGAFSVSQSAEAEVRRYIARQEEHHRTLSFQEEYRAFLQRYGVDFDERYVWD